MDKSKVLAAYKRGFLTARECGQILGMDEAQLQSLLQLEDDKPAEPPRGRKIGG
ncbi:hypothetical protein [Paenibacillus sp. NFR01]|uniref:hypothetical protein n=1 Tax=Paenibacillus sp. NFR01 TaxID=1566279 RepID=UPI0008ADD9EA|nr:hypothetical protein [Paenibacillus sp. NFR01]SET52544.1 hypothetical protein SAMN03159358_1930 [Paenibacillus sp. NFR01]